MTDEIKLGHCKTCNRLEPATALIGGRCSCCWQEAKRKCQHHFYILALSIAAAISTIGLVFCLWRP